jgi:prepilin-type N-terminal cleavage/methylation domain-containing protein
MNKQKGFTIIELIVVIAIIAVLAAIVLVNVTQYIAKGKDASIKGNMSSMATIAASFYDNNTSDFTGLRVDAAFAAGVAAIDDANGGEADDANAQADASNWCVSSPLNATGIWCVDSTGFKGALLTGSCDGAADANGFVCN